MQETLSGTENQAMKKKWLWATRAFTLISGGVVCGPGLLEAEGLTGLLLLIPASLYLWILWRLRTRTRAKGLAFAVALGCVACALCALSLILGSGDPCAGGGETYLGILASSHFALAAAAIMDFRVVRRNARAEGAKEPRIILRAVVYSLPLLLLGFLILVPTLPSSRRSAGKVEMNESRALGSMRSISTAQIAYASTYETGFSASLTSLGEPAEGSAPSATVAGLVDNRTASGATAGYQIDYKPGPVEGGRITTFTVTARPTEYGCSARKSYFSDQTGVIRVTDENRAATPQDLPVGEKVELYPAIDALAFSPDGKLLATGDGEMVARIWEFPKGREVRTLRGHTAGIRSVSFSPDGTILATGSTDKTVRLWNSATGEQTRMMEGLEGLNPFLAFSPDGRVLAANDARGAVHFWNVATGSELYQTTDAEPGGNPFVFLPGGKLVASRGRDDPATLWRVATRKPIRTFERTDAEVAVFALALSPDAKTLAGGIHDGTVRLWDVATGKEARKLGPRGEAVTLVAFSPDGKTLLVIQQPNVIRLWQVASGTELWKKQDYMASGNALSFSPDGGALACGNVDGSISILEISSGKETRKFGTRRE